MIGTGARSEGATLRFGTSRGEATQWSKRLHDFRDDVLETAVTFRSVESNGT
jgi:hypothetical protein